MLALLIFLALQFSVQNFRVEGSSMDPTLDEGEYLLVNKLVYFRLDPDSWTRSCPSWISRGRNSFSPSIHRAEERLPYSVSPEIRLATSSNAS